MELVNEAGREFILRELMEPIVDNYDFIIIDCPPSLGLLTLNALTSSHYVLIPLQSEFLAIQGLTRIKQIVDKVKFRLNKRLEICGVVATMYDARKVLKKEKGLVSLSIAKTVKENVERPSKRRKAPTTHLFVSTGCGEITD